MILGDLLLLLVLFFQGKGVDFSKSLVDRLLEFKVKYNAPDLPSSPPDSFGFALVGAVDCGVVTGFCALQKASMKCLLFGYRRWPVVLQVTQPFTTEREISLAFRIGNSLLDQAVFRKVIEIALRVFGDRHRSGRSQDHHA